VRVLKTFPLRVAVCVIPSRGSKDTRKKIERFLFIAGRNNQGKKMFEKITSINTVASCITTVAGL
jgi:hypothetical protein